MTEAIFAVLMWRRKVSWIDSLISLELLPSPSSIFPSEIQIAIQLTRLLTMIPFTGKMNFGQVDVVRRKMQQQALIGKPRVSSSPASMGLLPWRQ